MTSARGVRRGRSQRRGRAALVGFVAAVLAACSPGGTDSAGPATVANGAESAASTDDRPVDCPVPTVQVDTAAALRDTLARVAPGDVIGLADGVYDGEFIGTAVGTAEAPIWMCGSRAAVLRGTGVGEGTVLRLAQTSHWRLVGFSLTRGQKGLVADGVGSSVFQDLAVSEIGDEALHLRSGSSRNVVRGLTISGTGLRVAKFGEGIYVGSAESNWCRISNCEPDRSDDNVLIGNTITDTTAEAIDIKEGTSGGVLRDNVFDGSGLRGSADSWVDVKGNNWLVQNNRGTSARVSGFQVHEVVAGWGTGNVFDGNVADVRGSGYGFELRPVGDNRVSCSNVAIAAASGLTNTTCR